MKKIITTLCLLSAVLTAPAQDTLFTVKLSIPGMAKGSRVQVKQENVYDPMATTTTDGTANCQLQGSVSRPVKAVVRILPPAKEGDRPQDERDREIQFMLEPGVTTISAACLDSVPYGYEMTSSPIFKEQNITVKGGKAEEQYLEWRKFILPAEITAFKKNLLYRDADFGLISGKPAEDKTVVARLLRESQEEEARVDSLNQVFCRLHPDNLMSVALTTKSLERPFCYTQAEVDEAVKRMANNYDQQGYAELKQKAEAYRTLARGTTVTDVELQTPDGAAARFADVLVKGKWNLIDFWASWCGPCRMAIPQVKELSEELADKLNVVSVSLDKKTADWHRAMDEEKMPWKQFICPKQSLKTLTTTYQIQAIPYLMVVSPDGKVMYSTWEPGRVRKFIMNSL